MIMVYIKEMLSISEKKIKSINFLICDPFIILQIDYVIF